MPKLAFVSFRPAAALLVLCNGLITAQFQNIFLAGFWNYDGRDVDETCVCHNQK